MIHLKLVKTCITSYKKANKLSIFHCYWCHNESLFRTNIFKGIDKQSLQDSNEIINLSNDSKLTTIPVSQNIGTPRFHFENKTIDTYANERSTIDLSSNMHANLPQPPSEAVKSHERPYDSIVSLGDSYVKNDKFLSEELISVHKSSNLCQSKYITEDQKLSLYCSNEKRFNISFGPNTVELISQGTLSVDTALSYQNNIMKKVTKFWLKSKNLSENSPLQLFLPFTADDVTEINIKSFLELYNLLGIDEKHDNYRLKSDQISCSKLVEEIDKAVIRIVNNWFQEQNINILIDSN